MKIPVSTNFYLPQQEISSGCSRISCVKVQSILNGKPELIAYYGYSTTSRAEVPVQRQN